jgi:hypothetical protein
VGFDDTEESSKSSQLSSEDSDNTGITIHGDSALDAFVRGKVGLEDLDFEDSSTDRI